MIRTCKIIAIVVIGTVAAEALFVVPTRELVAILIVVMAVTMQFSRGKENEFRTIFYVSALSALGFLYLGQPVTTSSVIAAKPLVVETREAGVSTYFDPKDGSMTVKYSGDYLRPIKEERKQLLQESPEEWKRQLRERLEMYRSGEN